MTFDTSDLERHSNLGSLVMAVLVGVLSLASNQYARMDPDKLDSFFAGWSFGEEEEESLPATAPTDLDVLYSELSTVETNLDELFVDFKSHKRLATDPEITAALKRLDPLVTELDQARRSISPGDRIIAMRSLFVAAEIDPHRFSSTFRVINSDVMDNETEEVAARAAVLRIYHALNLQSPQQRPIFNTISQFAQSYPNSDRQGILLCSMISRELWTAAHYTLSEQVLHHGKQTYSGSAGVSHLVNQMIEQRDVHKH